MNDNVDNVSDNVDNVDDNVDNVSDNVDNVGDNADNDNVDLLILVAADVLSDLGQHPADGILLRLSQRGARHHHRPPFEPEAIEMV